MSDDIIKRLREAIAEHPLAPLYGFSDNIAALLDRLDAAERERDSKAAELANLQVAFSDWKVFHSTARLEAENERLRSANVEGKLWVDAAVEDMKMLRAENEALTADALRYRWLRGREDDRYMTVYAFRTDVDEVCLGEELDATIDAAMAAEQSDEV